MSGYGLQRTPSLGPTAKSIRSPKYSRLNFCTALSGLFDTTASLMPFAFSSLSMSKSPSYTRVLIWQWS